MADEKHTGSIFWIYFTFLSAVSLIYLAFWSFKNESIQGIATALILLLMIIFSYIFSQGELFKLRGSFRKNAFYFTLAFLLWGGVVVWKKIQQGTGQIFSILSTVTPTQNVLFAEVSAKLPQFWQFVIDQITNPFIEETFWLIGLTFGIIWILKLIGEESKRFSWVSNPVFILITSIIIAGVTFPLFHIPSGTFSAIFPFILSAFMFRTIIITLYWGDDLLDIFPNVTVIASFAVGMHMANNWFDFGFFRGLQLLSSEVYGWVIIITFGILLLAGVDYAIETPLNLLFKDE